VLRTTRRRSCRAAVDRGHHAVRRHHPKAFTRDAGDGGRPTRPRGYPDPERFDITRETDPSTIYFGFGIHRCSAPTLARLEMRVAFEELVTRFPGLAVDESRIGAPRLQQRPRGGGTCPC